MSPVKLKIRHSDLKIRHSDQSNICRDFGQAYAKTFNVVNYGAIGNGSIEDTQAFLDAWKATCNSSDSSPIMTVPGGNSFLLQPFTLDGSNCKSTSISIVIDGELIAPKNPSAWKYKGKECRQWILLKHMKGLVIKGSGTINGRGNTWWHLSCKNKNKRCCRRKPTGLILEHSEKVHIKDLAFKDSPQMHMAIERSKYVYVKNLNIQAPSESPNTDGIHIQHSRKIVISMSNIRTGDDCISIGDGSYRINISSIACGPGHGISIGSLGKHGGHETVEFVNVKDVIFTGTTNGARIKTWQGGSGYARNINFEGIISRGSSNPIIIDQFYCDHEKCKNQTSAVKISNVVYSKISGTSRSKIAVNLACSESVPCRNIFMKDIELGSIHEDEQQITSSYCGNVVNGLMDGTVIPTVPCLNPMSTLTVPILYDSRFNERDNYIIDYKVAEIDFHDQMSFLEFQQLVVDKISSVGNCGNVEIIACVGSKDFIKKDLKLREDNDIRWLFYLISSGENFAH
ncbi:probable polygalacturonase At1g80170 [Benincasa hispida]|uniref:probable polygalacturonase At1g80170 n=1 Tax=Benincasa hispida TaxID=102211 RepID=UPI001902A282|nr:probable polygalacturonase At1g80170 [Benincasa hispida]